MLLLQWRRDGSPRITGAGDDGCRDWHGLRTRMQKGRSRSRGDGRDRGVELQTGCAQKRPRESSQGGAEEVCSSPTKDEVGKQPRRPFGSKQHGATRGAVRDWDDQDGEGRATGQHRTSDRAEHIGDDVHGEPRGNDHPKSLCGSGWQDTDGEGAWNDRTQ